MTKLRKLSKNKFYAIDYKTSLVVELTEDELEKTYTSERMITNYYATSKNKMMVHSIPDISEVIRYYKLYKNNEVARELEIGDIVRDKEDFIYRILINKNNEFYCKMIGDSVLFADPSVLNLSNEEYFTEGDDEYDS